MAALKLTWKKSCLHLVEVLNSLFAHRRDNMQCVNIEQKALANIETPPRWEFLKLSVLIFCCHTNISLLHHYFL